MEARRVDGLVGGSRRMNVQLSGSVGVSVPSLCIRAPRSSLMRMRQHLPSSIAASGRSIQSQIRPRGRSIKRPRRVQNPRSPYHEESRFTGRIRPAR